MEHLLASSLYDKNAIREILPKIEELITEGLATPELYDLFILLTGRLNQNGAGRDLVNIQPLGERYIKRFKIVGREFRACFNLPQEMGDIEQVYLTMYECFEQLAERLLRDVQDNDFVSVEIHSDYLETPIYVPFIRSQFLTAEKIMSCILTVLQSKKEFQLDKSFYVKLIHVKMPRGGAKNKIIKCYNLLAHLKRKKSVIQINNADNLCLPRALVLAKVRLDSGYGEMNKLRSSPKRLKQMTIDFCATAGVGIDLPAMGLTEVQTFQSIMPGYRIVVLSKEHLNSIIYRGDPADKNIYLYLHDNHFDVITKMGAFLDKSYFCNHCLIGYNYLKGHKCEKKCAYCHRTNTSCGNNNNSIRHLCELCNTFCPTADCLHKHKTNCKLWLRCTDCGRVSEKNRPHRCGTKFCRVCMFEMPIEHVCYMRKLNVKKDTDPPKYIFFDFESVFIAEQGYLRHEPNLCVASVPCFSCITGDYNPECPNCVRKIFEGLDCKTDFCQWLFSPENDGSTAICQNFKAYDSLFILNYMYSMGLKPNVVMNGRKTLCLEFNGIRIIDSHCFFIAPLSSLPKTFGLQEIGCKGYFPYLFNTLDNQNYEGKLPAVEFYNEAGMKPEARAEFLAWHSEHANDHFNLKRELLKYCQQDVLILERCSLKFRQLFLEHTGCDPFRRCMTISQACNVVFRQNYLMENTIELLSPRMEEKHSVEALRYLKWVSHKRGISIRHARNGGEVKIGPYKVDGLHSGNHVVEYCGCPYHGCVKCYKDRDKLAPGREHLTFRDVHQRDLARTKFLEEKGYVVERIFSCEYREMLKNDVEMREFIKKLEIPERLCPRASFYGGRVEAFSLFKETAPGERLMYKDIRSLYPFVMRTGRFPVGNHVVITENFEADLTQYEGLIHCRILPPRGLNIPVLPYRIAGKLLFPLCGLCAAEMTDVCRHTDRERCLTGTWVLLEVLEALRSGYVIDKVFEIWHYGQTSQYDPATKTGGLFTEYVDNFYRLKCEGDGYPVGCDTSEAKQRYVEDIFAQEGLVLRPDHIAKNPGLRAICKLCLNSMYGKLGQRPSFSTTEFISEPERLYQLLTSEDIEVQDIQFVNDEVLRVTFQTATEFLQTPGNTNVVLASYITCLGRLELLKYLRQVACNLNYCDTDSCVYLIRENDTITCSPYLGGMADEILKEHGENSEMKTFCCSGPKSYAYEVSLPDGSVINVLKIKGICLSFRARSVITFEAFERLVKHRNSAERLVITDPYKILRNKDATVISKSESKEFKFTYTKRVILPDSYDTVPFGY